MNHPQPQLPSKMIRTPLRYFLIFAVLLTLIVSASPSALALDTIRLASEQVSGEIQSMTRDEVVIKPIGGAAVRTITTDQIISITYTGQPGPMQMLVSQLSQSNYGAITRTLEMDSLKPERISDERIKAEVAFYSAYAAAQSALSGAGDLEAAGASMRDYVNANSNHWRYYTAAQTLGELYSAVGADDEAIRAFSLLRDAPSDEIKLNGAMAQAKSLMAAERYDQAVPLFDEVLNAGGTSDAAKKRALVAEVGKISCNARLGDAEDGISTLKGIIDEGDSEDAELFAMAYTALGNCHLAAGQNEEALLAFLHIDLLYPSQARYRAEALYHLSRLWGEVGQGDRALQARQTLLSTFGDSTWARKSAGQ